jgi:hypothetical protein
LATFAGNSKLSSLTMFSRMTKIDYVEFSNTSFLTDVWAFNNVTSGFTTDFPTLVVSDNVDLNYVNCQFPQLSLLCSLACLLSSCSRQASTR